MKCASQNVNHQSQILGDWTTKLQLSNFEKFTIICSENINYSLPELRNNELNPNIVLTGFGITLSSNVHNESSKCHLCRFLSLMWH